MVTAVKSNVISVSGNATDDETKFVSVSEAGWASWRWPAAAGSRSLAGASWLAAGWPWLALAGWLADAGC